MSANAKLHLLLECDNVKQMLDETLRYRYNATVTADFYDECDKRLDYLRHLIQSTDDDDPDIFDPHGLELNDLSCLITSIERSHLEEFAWPFAEALKRIMAGICTDVLFFFRAEGDVNYIVVPEDNRAGVFDRKIEPVVFPRALKESVLIHAVIGHEFGHSAIASQPRSLRAITKMLVKNSALEDGARLYEWCAKNTGATVRVTNDELDELVEGWAEEFFCDIFGLITMGPAFLPAFQVIIEWPEESSPYVSTHPPFAARAIALLQAARTLGLLYSGQKPRSALGDMSAPLDDALIACAENADAQKFAILDPKQVSKATEKLLDVLKAYDLLVFPPPDADLIAQLVGAIDQRIPPAARLPAVLRTDSDGRTSIGGSDAIDFRHILLAGWLNWMGPGKRDPALFGPVNRLCSHAIMQQQGIFSWTSGVDSWAKYKAALAERSQ